MGFASLDASRYPVFPCGGRRPFRVLFAVASRERKRKLAPVLLVFAAAQLGGCTVRLRWHLLVRTQWWFALVLVLVAAHSAGTAGPYIGAACFFIAALVLACGSTHVWFKAGGCWPPHWFGQARLRRLRANMVKGTFGGNK